MQITQTIEETRTAISAAKAESKRVGFVPTMGFLHEGHLSLVRRSVAENDRTLVSIFVNPTQFDANADLAAYPRTLDADLDLLEKKLAETFTSERRRTADEFATKIKGGFSAIEICGIPLVLALHQLVLQLFGQTLGQDTTLTFPVGDPVPTFYGPQGMVVVDPGAKRPSHASGRRAGAHCGKR